MSGKAMQLSVLGPGDVRSNDGDTGTRSNVSAPGTQADATDMRRMGKEQELNRNFNFFAIFGYSLILGNAWVVCMVTSIFGLTNGGTAGSIWMFIVVAGCMFCSTLSMAEMASMAPTAGGQYHWVSEFAPAGCQKLLSFIVGWMCVLGWQTAMSASAYTPALAIQGIIAINNENYTLPGWHAFLLTLAILLLSIIINVFLIRKLPLLEGIMVIVFFCCFGAVLITLWVKADKASAKDVFTVFSDNSGWGSKALATLIGGLQGGFSSLMGSDSAAHLSEELKDASYWLPRSMVCTALANYLTGILTIITLMFCLGGTAEQLIGTRYGQPYVQVFYNATKTNGGATALAAVVALLTLFTSINQVTTTSRQLYAFARDGGLPFSPFLAKVNSRWGLPLNALWITLLFTFILSFIIIGSTVAFNIMTTLSSAGLLTSYILCIGCVLYRRIFDSASLPASHFNLGRWGVAINGIAVAFQSLVFVMLFFPVVPHPTAAGMNWTILIYGVTWILCLLYYYVGKSKSGYRGPVEKVKKFE